MWDEPLNYIDIYSRLQIERLIQAFSPTMIFVEHDFAFQTAIATKIVPVIPKRRKKAPLAVDKQAGAGYTSHIKRF